MKRLTSFIVKRPVKILLVTLVVIIGLTIGATQITLKTGNDTLISDKTDIYLDNQAYQNEFGKDPIILIFDEESSFEAETLFLMNKIQSEINDLDGVFSINSPITVMNQMSIMMYEQTNTGLLTMSNGLTEISNQLALLSTNLGNNSPEDLPDLEALQTNINQLINAQNQLDNGLVNMFNVLDLLDTSLDTLKVDIGTLKLNLDNDPGLLEEYSLAEGIEVKVNMASASIKQLLLGDGIKAIPPQTATALGEILTALSTMSLTLTTTFESMGQLSLMLNTLGENIGLMGANLSQMQKNFNTFKPGFPSSSKTIEMMIYEEGEIRENYKNFMIGENKLRMVVVLSGNVTDDQIDVISDKIFNIVKLEGKVDSVLISGKPILDRSIKSSMMDSMQIMMITAVAIMVLILSLIYNVRMRLLPIFMILIAVGVTIGLMGWLSIGLTMVSMAVFPVLIGLGIDYFIQFQTRYEEERSKL